MPWTTPTLRQVRMMVRDDVAAALGGAVIIGNSVLRVISDAEAGLAHLVLRYVDWLSKQLLPDTAERDWLDRHGDIWLVNSDGSVGRKDATFAKGVVTMTGLPGVTIASGTLFTGFNVNYETIDQFVMGAGPTEVAVRALEGGIVGNLRFGDTLSLVDDVFGVDRLATVVIMEGGTDAENDDDLRSRVLFRIQEPPMGGDSNDYVAWTLSVSGVTRAWVSNEMGLGTVTVRFMMDDLRAPHGFPLGEDIIKVRDFLNSVRPVSIKDLFVVAPVPYPIDFRISNLTNDEDSTRAAIEVSVATMLRRWAAPAHTINGIRQDAQMIYASWVSDAVLQASGVESFTLTMTDQTMPYNGSLAVLGTIVYDNS